VKPIADCTRMGLGLSGLQHGIWDIVEIWKGDGLCTSIIGNVL